MTFSEYRAIYSLSKAKSEEIIQVSERGILIPGSCDTQDARHLNSPHHLFSYMAKTNHREKKNKRSVDSLHCHSLGMQRLRLGNSDPTDKTGIRKQGPDSQAFLQAAPPEALPLPSLQKKGPVLVGLRHPVVMGRKQEALNPFPSSP